MFCPLNPTSFSKYLIALSHRNYTRKNKKNVFNLPKGIFFYDHTAFFAVLAFAVLVKTDIT